VRRRDLAPRRADGGDVAARASSASPPPGTIASHLADLYPSTATRRPTSARIRKGRLVLQGGVVYYPGRDRLRFGIGRRAARGSADRQRLTLRLPVRAY
jgi:hypothetical protein